MRRKNGLHLYVKYLLYMIFFVVPFVLGHGTIVEAESVLQLEAEVADTQNVLLEWNSEDASYIFQIQRRVNDTASYQVMATLSGQVGMVKCYDSAVTMGKQYTYRVVRMLGEEVQAQSNEVKVTVTLAKPTAVKSKVVDNTSVQVSWRKVQKATSYTVYRSSKTNTGYKKIATVKKNRYVDGNVVQGKSYYYKIVANYKKKAKWSSLKSEVVSAHLKPVAPSVVGSYTKKKVKLTWKKVKGASAYYVYKKNSDGQFEKVKETDKLYYRDGDVKKRKTYTYKVIAIRKKDGKIIKSKASRLCKVLAAEIDPNKKMIALTYDDGPSRYTKDILNCLKQNQAKATFYVIGCNVDSYKDAVVEAHEMGCEIGNHTYTHPMLFRLSTEQIKKEIVDTDKKIKRLIGSNAVTMRPPGGGLDQKVEQTVGKPIILWSIDTRDWEHRNSARIINSVMNNVKDGDIILMHDIYKTTKDASLVLIPRLRREGYQLVTVSELAEYRGYTLKKGKVYRNLRKTK